MPHGREPRSVAGDDAIVALDGPAAEEDRLLVAGLRDGSAAASAELCRRYGPRLHRFAAALLVGDGPLAEDMAIQALAEGARNIRRFNPRRSTLAAWLYGIARRQVQSELRRQRRRKSIPASAQVTLESVAGFADDVDIESDCTARLEARQKVVGIAKALTDVEFEVLVLHCVDEFTAGEIGRIVGRSERAIHSILHRAREKARERPMSDEEGAD